MVSDFTQREYCVQYIAKRTFLLFRGSWRSRVCTTSSNTPTANTFWLLANNAGARRAAQGVATVRFASILNHTENVITEIQIEHNFLAGNFATQDYNFEVPSLDLNTRIAGRNGFEHFQYPGHFLKRAEGEERAGVRLQDQELARFRIRGSGGCRGLSSNAEFKLRDHYHNELHRDCLITPVVHESSQEGNFTVGHTLSDGGFDHKSKFECIPFATPFRPSRLTPRPFVAGTQTAVIVGRSGEEIWTDQYGRVKVKFHWDRYSKGDENSSCWIRVSQSLAGKN